MFNWFLCQAYQLAISMWAVISLPSDRIQVCCLEETYLEPIILPLTLAYVGNGCEAYCTNIYIPSKTDLTSEKDTSSRHDFFVSFNVIYPNIMWYGIWSELKLETLTSEQKDLLGVKLSELPLMTLEHLGKRIKKIGTSYPWSIPPMVYLSVWYHMP